MFYCLFTTLNLICPPLTSETSYFTLVVIRQCLHICPCHIKYCFLLPFHKIKKAVGIWSTLSHAKYLSSRMVGEGRKLFLFTGEWKPMPFLFLSQRSISEINISKGSSEITGGSTTNQELPTLLFDFPPLLYTQLLTPSFCSGINLQIKAIHASWP